MAITVPIEFSRCTGHPIGDSNYSRRVGRIKILFARALQEKETHSGNLTESRRKHRASDVWQRRIWEHTIRKDKELAYYLDYVHYNPVKHGLVSCPHQWPIRVFGNGWVKSIVEMIERVSVRRKRLSQESFWK